MTKVTGVLAVYINTNNDIIDSPDMNFAADAPFLPSLSKSAHIIPNTIIATNENPADIPAFIYASLSFL